jgi:DNA-binding transcriptional LysR family regulator
MKATAMQLRAVLHLLRHAGYANAERATGISRTTLHTGVKGAEQAYGCRFFEPEPFRPTRCGRIIHPALEEIVRYLDVVEERLALAARPRLRIIASEVATQEYLPGIVAEFEQLHPDMACETHSRDEAGMRAQLADDEADCALALESPAWKGYSRALILTLPLALICRRDDGIASLDQLWSRSPLPFRVVLPASTPTLEANFERGTRGLGVAWPNHRKVSSLKAVPAFVRRGDLGVVVLEPSLTRDPAFRVFELKHFPPVNICLFWKGKKSREIATLIGLLRKAAAAMRT